MPYTKGMAGDMAVTRPFVCMWVAIQLVAMPGIVRADVSRPRPKPQLLPAKLPPERREIPVIDLVDEPNSVATHNAIRDELLRHDSLKPLIEPQIGAVLTGALKIDEDKDLLDETQAFKVQAEEQLLAFQLNVAQSKAQDGLRRLNSVTPTPLTMQLAADLALVMAQAKLGDNVPNEAAEWFTLVHRLHPTRHLDTARYLPQVVAAFEQAAPKPVPVAPIQIVGSYGRVFIDGVDVGVPNATYEVQPGLHMIQIAGPLRQPRGAVDVYGLIKVSPVPAKVAPNTPPATVSIPDATADSLLLIARSRVTLSKTTDPAQRDKVMNNLVALISDANNKAHGASRQTEITDAVVISHQNGKLVAQAWRAHVEGFDKPIFNAPIDAAAVRARPVDLLAWFSPPRPLQAIDNGTALPDAPPSWYEKRWVQASALGAIIVIGLSTYFYSQRGGGMSPVDPMVNR